MFTGIIQSVGSLTKKEITHGDARFFIDTGKLDLTDVLIGDSIACNGVCLTVVELFHNGYVADVSAETLTVSTLSQLNAGDTVNLEKALRLQDRLGGHLVSGHVDGIGVVKSIEPDARSWRYTIEAPLELARYIASKGSICIDGISLTVNKVDGCQFDVNIVPHTRQETIIGSYQIGQAVNLEVDLLARYLERMLTAPSSNTESSSITRELLAENGFI